MSKVHSGISIHYSNLKVIQLETCMILSLSKTQNNVGAIPKNMAKKSSKYTQLVAMDLRAINMNGRKKKPRKIY